MSFQSLKRKIRKTIIKTWNRLSTIIQRKRVTGVEQGIDPEVKLEHNDKRQENQALNNNNDSCLVLNDLPENCIFDILARLPVETLSCSRFLCKSWYEIINSPDFINAHLHPSDSTTGLIFLAEHGFKFMEIKDGKSTTKEYYMKLNFTGRIMATCNGLVVLEYLGSIFLLNPVTREQEEIPLGTISSSLPVDLYGLAFCRVSRRYKLLHLFFKKVCGLGCEIMEIGSGKWRAVDVPPMERCFGLPTNPIIFAMGALHWIQYIADRGDQCMVSMPLDDEKFKIRAIPGDHRNYLKSIFAMGEFVGFASHRNANRIGVWILRGLGGEWGWEKQHDIDTSGLIYDISSLLFCGGVKGSDDQLVFKSGHGCLSFYAYDPHSQLTRKIESTTVNYDRYFPHVNSLVSWRRNSMVEDFRF